MPIGLGVTNGQEGTFHSARKSEWDQETKAGQCQNGRWMGGEFPGQGEWGPEAPSPTTFAGVASGT